MFMKAVSGFFSNFASRNTIKMEKQEKVQYWLDIADEDLAVAEDMHLTKHWLYVAFMCHLNILEKTKLFKQWILQKF